MKVGGVSKGSNDGMKASGSRSHEPKNGREPETRAQSTAEDLVVSVQSGNEGSGSLCGNYNLKEREKVGKKEMMENQRCMQQAIRVDETTRKL